MLSTYQIQSIFNLVSADDNSVYDLYKLVGEATSHTPLDELIFQLGIQNTQEARLAVADRIAGMREDSITNVLKTLQYNQTQIAEAMSICFTFVSKYHEDRQQNLLSKILKLEIPKFYKTLFNTNFHIGTTMTKLHLDWEKIVVDGTNKDLLKTFGTNENAIKFLAENDLFDKGHDGLQADRSYSILIKDGDRYVAKTYAEAFPEHITKISVGLSNAIAMLDTLDLDVPENEVAPWLAYFKSFQTALVCTERHECVPLWAQVDRDWMKITGPIQMVHPIEYYDDFLRNAVSIEWDLRVDDPTSLENNRGVSVLEMFKSKYHNFTGKHSDTTELGHLITHNMKKVQLHIGKQVFFSGGQYKGLASAQVIPNDEVVSSEEGKKIFAFSEKSVELGRSKPPLLITREIFGEEITRFQHDLLFNRKEDYLTVYDITTIGHEYGHVLWKGMNTEINMNANGNFKNVEEFKASAGGMVSFFGTMEEKTLWKEVFLNTLQRSIRLISWKNVDEVKPYYCEALITLNILFDSKVLSFDGKKLHIDISKDAYSRFAMVYTATYDLLVKDYLTEVSADIFLFKNMKFVNNSFLPLNQEIEDFVLFYYDLNTRIGRTIDTITKF